MVIYVFTFMVALLASPHVEWNIVRGLLSSRFARLSFEFCDGLLVYSISAVSATSVTCVPVTGSVHISSCIFTLFTMLYPGYVTWYVTGSLKL